MPEEEVATLVGLEGYGGSLVPEEDSLLVWLAQALVETHLHFQQTSPFSPVSCQKRALSLQLSTPSLSVNIPILSSLVPEEGSHFTVTTHAHLHFQQASPFSPVSCQKRALSSQSRTLSLSENIPILQPQVFFVNS